MKAQGRKPKGTGNGVPPVIAPGESAQARERILDAAESAFARKGFDGARVDEIAEAAGVNKALIYYYFKSKKALLEELTMRLLATISAQKEDAFASLQTGDVDFMETLVSRLTRTMKARLPIFNILFAEALKEDNQDPALFRVMDRHMKASVALAEKHGFAPPPPMDEWRVPALFFGSFPWVFFMLLKDKWVAHYKVNENELEEEFFRHFKPLISGWIHLLLKKK